MEIAIIADIHDNIWNLERVVDSINSDGSIETVINLGDLRSPFIVKQLAQLNKKQYMVFSVPDLGDGRLEEACKKAGIEYFQDFGELEIDGKKIGFTHEERLARRLKGFDVVFYGHLHQYKVERASDGTLLVCCGEVMGRKMPACYVTYDTKTEEVKKVEV
jgi:putative phosphoesterase